MPLFPFSGPSATTMRSPLQILFLFCAGAAAAAAAAGCVLLGLLLLPCAGSEAPEEARVRFTAVAAAAEPPPALAAEAPSVVARFVALPAAATVTERAVPQGQRYAGFYHCVHIHRIYTAFARHRDLVF